MPSETTHGLAIRTLVAQDLEAVVRIDAAHTGRERRGYWRRVIARFCGEQHPGRSVAMAADVDGELAGFLFGEAREVEYGSEPCGWIFAVGVLPGARRHGAATRLLRSAAARFRQLGVTRLRTMVERTDVPLLSFFRASGFVGGPYVQLEMQPDAAGAIE